jgi:hypothetical protein
VRRLARTRTVTLRTGLLCSKYIDLVKNVDVVEPSSTFHSMIVFRSEERSRRENLLSPGLLVPTLTFLRPGVANQASIMKALRPELPGIRHSLPHPVGAITIRSNLPGQQQDFALPLSGRRAEGISVDSPMSR